MDYIIINQCQVTRLYFLKVFRKKNNKKNAIMFCTLPLNQALANYSATFFFGPDP